jgi:OOP family OmpA-OmpF porin
MRKTILAVVAFVCAVSIWSTSVVQAYEIITREIMEKEIVTETDLIKTADNFIVMFDSSNSMNGAIPGTDMTKIQALKAMLKERAEWMPDLGYTAGLFNMTSTGHEEIYPILPWNREAFSAAIDKLPEKGSGPTMLQPALSSLREPLAGLSGRTAVLMFTDGNATVVRGPKKPLQIAQEIAKESDVCFYVISSATEAVNEQLVKSLASINSCSRVIPFDAFLENPHYLSGALFTIKTTSYEKLVPVEQVVGIVGKDMLFDFDSTEIRSEYHEKLQMLGEFLKNNPEAHVVAAGFTDNTGPEEYNLYLSEQRVTAVKTYLVENGGIDASRIATLWYGPLNPVGDNATKEGRQLNRRVELAVGGIN